jgi:exopolysaccharide biosynthesis polyprenyl glycosylphosphotransferase
MGFTLAFLEAGSVFGAVCVLMAMRPHPTLLDGLGVPAVVAPALAVSGCYLASSYFNELYPPRALRDVKASSRRTVQLLALTVLLLGAGYALLPGVELSAPLLLWTSLLVLGLVMPLRAMSHGMVARGPAVQRVLMLGTGPLARRIVEGIEASSHPHYSVVGMVDDGGNAESPPAPPARSPALPTGGLEEMERLIEELSPHRLVVALNERRGRLPVGVLLSSCASGLRVEDGVEFYERLTRKLAIESLSPSFIIFHRVLEKSALQLGVRRALSVAAAAIGLVLAAPLMAVVAVLVKLDSAGPVFFTQERVGFRGRIFRLIKFRTMQGDPPDDHQVWRRDDEPRLTRLGRQLRDTHFDELPQFFNVLKGDMDMVGPRPEMACNVQAMTEHIPYYGLRHTVRPGMTGWAQIKQGYAMSMAEVTEKMRYDLYYIKHMSLWLDLRILLATGRIFLFGRKAAR